MAQSAIPPHITLRSDTHVLVVGLGKSGFAAAKFLHQQGIKISVSDMTTAERINPEQRQWLADNRIFLETGRHSTELFTAVDCIIVSPGVPLNIEPLQAARRKAIPVLGEMAVAAQFLKTPVVAVTGTNGKTTVTTLLGEIFRQCCMKVFVGGNIGTPLFEYLCGPQDADVVVLEISSFQLDTGGGAHGLRPAIALLLNISPDHLDRYESFPAYARSKFQIFAAQHENDAAIVNSDDPEIMSRSDLWPRSRCYFFGLQTDGRPGASLQGNKVVLSADISPRGKTELYDLTDSALARPPNLQNGMAAILAARLMGCSQESVVRGLNQFRSLPHRMTLVAEINGIKFIDDSKATNIGAVHAALTAMENNVLLIAGGRDKGGDYALLKDVIREKVKLLLLIGEARDKMAGALQMAAPIKAADTLQEAVRMAVATAELGDVVLLSPACASFDMFASYEERGDVFSRAVLDLKQQFKIVTNN
jgi:UDP-N-acetylmuramoylalanine--D-glutamate ligase